MSRLIKICPLFEPNEILHRQIEELKREVEIEQALGYPITPRMISKMRLLINQLQTYTHHLEGLVMDGIEVDELAK